MARQTGPVGDNLPEPKMESSLLVIKAGRSGPSTPVRSGSGQTWGGGFDQASSFEMLKGREQEM